MALNLREGWMQGTYERSAPRIILPCYQARSRHRGHPPVKSSVNNGVHALDCYLLGERSLERVLSFREQGIRPRHVRVL